MKLHPSYQLRYNIAGAGDDDDHGDTWVLRSLETAASRVKYATTMRGLLCMMLRMEEDPDKWADFGVLPEALSERVKTLRVSLLVVDGSNASDRTEALHQLLLDMWASVEHTEGLPDDMRCPPYLYFALKCLRKDGASLDDVVKW